MSVCPRCQKEFNKDDWIKPKQTSGPPYGCTFGYFTCPKCSRDDIEYKEIFRMTKIKKAIKDNIIILI